MRDNGFAVQEVDTSDLDAVKADHDVPFPLHACHTAIVDGYVVEGHVPAEDVRRLLEERPDIDGIAVPGMPVGSPGMEVPGQAPVQYDVIMFDEGDTMGTFASHN